jgi:hypothetical protein
MDPGGKKAPDPGSGSATLEPIIDHEGVVFGKTVNQLDDEKLLVNFVQNVINIRYLFIFD